MNDRLYKNAIFGGVATLMKALANPSRLEILELLSQGEKPVERIVELTGLSVANASQHLQVMKRNNLLRARKSGQYVYYTLASDEVLALYQKMTDYAVHELAELERLLNRQRKEYNTADAVHLEELVDLLENRQAILLDVRPSDEFEAGHIAGALSMPVETLLERLSTLSKEVDIIVYCRGPFCVLADEAVRTLFDVGYKVKRLHEGFPEWKLKYARLS
jgi:rhodanese-related sulfurtransferase/predicted transcriptional regulator